jgi:nucleotide-binding universal stress UspA family protein
MTHRISELVETGVGAEWFAESQLHSQPRIDAADVSDEGVRFERVLVPVDLSTGTLSVLRRASTLAHPGSIIRVLHAVQLNIAGEERGIARTGLIRELREAAREELGKLINSLWASETPAAIMIREGRPKDVILQEARAGNADLIVMGAHPHTGWRRVLHRNTAAYVMRHAPCPVLVVRA